MYSFDSCSLMQQKKKKEESASIKMHEYKLLVYIKILHNLACVLFHIRDAQI